MLSAIGSTGMAPGWNDSAAISRSMTSMGMSGRAASWINTHAGAACTSASRPARTDSCRVAPPVTKRISAMSARAAAATASAPAGMTTMIGAAPARDSASTEWRSTGLPRNGANCLGRGWPARNPWPAATTTPAMTGKGSDRGGLGVFMPIAGNRLPPLEQSTMRCLFFRHTRMFDPMSATPAAPKLAPIRIGPVVVDCPVILAPMTGVTDMPFRKLVRRFGSGLNVTEMIASPAMIRETRQSLQKSAWDAVEEPVSLQLGRLRSARNGRGGQAECRSRRRDHRYQYGLPGEKSCQWRCRVGADARFAAGRRG